MQKELSPGIKGKIEILVTPDNTARAFSSGTVDVFATPAMIALMEMTAQTSVSDCLPVGYITVGSEVKVKHIKATPINKMVWAFTELIAIENKKLIFNVEAHDENGKIGFGTHVRYMVEEKTFLENL